MKENAVIFYFCTGGDAFSQNTEHSLSIFFLIALSYRYTPVAAMCVPWSQRLSFNIIFFYLEICDAKH